MYIHTHVTLYHSGYSDVMKKTSRIQHELMEYDRQEISKITGSSGLRESINIQT